MRSRPVTDEAGTPVEWMRPAARRDEVRVLARAPSKLVSEDPQLAVFALPITLPTDRNFAPLCLYAQVPAMYSVNIGYKIPHDVIMGAIPRNPSGKILKHKLRAAVGPAASHGELISRASALIRLPFPHQRLPPDHRP